jgi:hypothetical protein
LLIVLVVYDLHFSYLDVAISVHVRDHRAFLILIEVRVRYYLPQLHKVKALKSDGFDGWLLVFPGELIERSSSLVDFDPAIEFKVAKNLVLGMKTIWFIAESDTGRGAFYIEHHGLALFSDEILLVIVEDAETIFAASLEKLVVIIAKYVDLFLGINSLYDIPRPTADKLDFLVVQSQADILFISKSVHNL